MGVQELGYLAHCLQIFNNLLTNIRPLYFNDDRSPIPHMREVHLGMDADLEKSRFGTRVVKNCVYLQVRDHFQGEVLREIVAQVGLLDGPPWQAKDADHLPRSRDKWFEGARG